MKDEPTTIALTGGKGLLGAILLRTIKGGVALTSDIRDSVAIARELKESGAAWVIHTAALTDVARCESDPELAQAVNADGTRNVVEAARAAGARIIYISTASVFDGRAGNYLKDDTPDPKNVYNITKRLGELATLAYDQGIVVRLNLIGVHPRGSRGKNFLEWLVDSLEADKDPTLFNDQIINPLSNWTVARLINELITKQITEPILHIGSHDRLSKAAIGKLVLAHFPEYRGVIIEKSIDTIADGVVRPKQMWLNTDRAALVFGTPAPTIAREIETIFSAAPFCT